MNYHIINFWHKIWGKKVSGLATLVLVAFFIAPAILQAAQEAEEEMIIKTKRITGEVEFIKPTYISITYARDKENRAEYGAMFLLNEDIKFSSKSLEDLQEGDKIAITYDEYFRIGLNEETGEEEEKFVKRITKEIKFLSSRPKSGLVSE